MLTRRRAVAAIESVSLILCPQGRGICCTSEWAGGDADLNNRNFLRTQAQRFILRDAATWMSHARFDSQA